MPNKKKWFPFTLFFLLIFLFMSCAEQCPCEEEPKLVNPPSQIVSVKDAKLMYDTYSTRRKPLIQRYEDSINHRKAYDKIKQANNTEAAVQTDSFPIARFVYYDYKTIKDYLTYIEQEAESKGVEISTLRFYFSNYPKDMSIKDAKPRQNSIFIMPTLTQDKRTFGYFLNEKEELQLLTNDLKVSKTPFKPSGEMTKASFLPEFKSSTIKPNYSFYEGKSYILNKGGGVPPPYSQQ